MFVLAGGLSHLRHCGMRGITGGPGGISPSSSSAEMKGWIRDAERYDDVTFIVMKVR